MCRKLICKVFNKTGYHELYISERNLTIPYEPPLPLSYWIDLDPTAETKSDHLGRENGLIPEDPPVPISYWIDLRLIEYYGPLVPELLQSPVIDIPGTASFGGFISAINCAISGGGNTRSIRVAWLTL